MAKIIKGVVLTVLSNHWQIEPIKDQSLQAGRGRLGTSHTAEEDRGEIGPNSDPNWCFNGFFVLSSWKKTKSQILQTLSNFAFIVKKSKRLGRPENFIGGVEEVVPLRADWLPLPVGPLIRKWHAHLYLAPLHAGYSDAFVPFSGWRQRTARDQPERQCQSHSDLLIPDGGGNAILIKSPPDSPWLRHSGGDIIALLLYLTGVSLVNNLQSAYFTHCLGDQAPFTGYLGNL